ncbi:MULTISPECIES: Gfo/Idh/MocA family protein [Rhizobium]|uniref:Gfo/Idh/MocA family oxidoreductase n=2 Tax=Rhizobium TaxID=379 RepID=A0A192T8J7_9HYPH|nr:MULTISPECIES: Gfo/Idh/MocA family oxidoreductase [Rhizobium]ACE90566.1 putative oxidoreductase protein [Rhizobium etli CIAT 652]MDH6649695.1 putative dehydrogenase [Rhizobium esperanzae]ANL40002.1 oxidoreductase protein [Rhizobium phaseoli]ANL52705.1 oxidoreductase protein [Rhizobium phaseoli]ANL58991.1 oxidoreductase protein [Rhizobium phaseoli]
MSPSSQGVPEKLRLAFLGGAVNSAVGRAHRDAIELDQKFDLVAGCFSRHDEINRETAAQYRIEPERCHVDFDTLLLKEAGNIDALVVLTPTQQHTKQVVAALEAGISVISEKALAGSSAETRMINNARSNGAFLAVTYNYTGYPMLREIRSMVEHGVFGELQQIHIEMPQETFLRLRRDGTPMTPQDWRLHDGPVPTVSLDLGVHVHSLLHFLTQREPKEVCATSQSFGNFPQVLDNVQALVRCAGGLHCSMWYGKTALGQRNGLRVRLYGSKASIEWLQETPEIAYFYDRKGRKQILDRASPDIMVANHTRYERFKAGHPSGFIEAFANYYADLADALLQRKANTACLSHPYVLGLDEAEEGLRLLEAIERSRLENRWVDIEPQGVQRPMTERIEIRAPQLAL